MPPVLFISSGLPNSAARSRLRSHHTQSWRSVALSSWLAAYCIRRFETPGTCPIPVTIETFASFAFASSESTFWRAGPSAAMSQRWTPAATAAFATGRATRKSGPAVLTMRSYPRATEARRSSSVASSSRALALDPISPAVRRARPRSLPAMQISETISRRARSFDETRPIRPVPPTARTLVVRPRGASSAGAK